MFYVEFQNNTSHHEHSYVDQISCHCPPPEYGLFELERFQALSTLRLVDKAFCRSASRLLFRYLLVKIDYDYRISSIDKFEALSSSEYASHVRQIRLTFKYRKPKDQNDGQLQYMEAMDNVRTNEMIHSKLVTEAIHHLSTLLVKFTSLKVLDIRPTSRMTAGVITTMVRRGLLLLATSKQDTIVELHIPVCNARDFIILPSHKEDGISVKALRNITFCGNYDPVDLPQVDLDFLTEAFPGLLSLVVTGVCILRQNSETSKCLVQLRSLDLSRVTIPARDLLDILGRGKNSIKFLALDRVVLVSGSWLHLLFQINMNLELFMFSIVNQSLRLDEQLSNGTAWARFGGLSKQYRLIRHALGDIERQINSTRLAVGLDELPSTTFRHLDYVPLESVMEEADYQKLSSRYEDFE